MKIDGAILAILVCASPIAATYLVFVALPNLMHSRFRHALWDVRDSIVDDVLDGRLTLNPATRKLLTTVHLAIKFAPDHTMRSGLTSVMLLRGEQIMPLEKVLTSKAVPRDQQPVLIGHYEKMSHATVEHLLWGSPSGWLFVVLILPWQMTRQMIKVRTTATTELSALPSLYPDVKPGIVARDLACAV